LVALTKRGMPPLEAIRAATVNAAELLGWQTAWARSRQGNMPI
jgi:imidazolonepropionase-like amidohydrolase